MQIFLDIQGIFGNSGKFSQGDANAVVVIGKRYKVGGVFSRGLRVCHRNTDTGGAKHGNIIKAVAARHGFRAVNPQTFGKF